MDNIFLIINSYLHLPPKLDKQGYNLTIDQHDFAAENYNSYRKTSFSWYFIQKVIEMIFSDYGPGFFIEAGALDGEFESYTLDMERKYGWRGLLIEPQEIVFQKLLKKNRKVYSSRSCISVKNQSYLVNSVDVFIDYTKK